MSAVPSTFASRREGALVPVLIVLSLVVSIVSSLGAPLLPSVAESLGVSLSSAQWSLTAALLAGAVAAPIMGRLGDGPYRRETIIGGLVIVCVGSVVAGVANTLPLLIVGRTMQGVGLGLAPLAMAAARYHLPAARAASVIGILSVSGAAGIGAGYPISGLIAEAFDVHAAFLFGGVLSTIVLVAAALVIPSSRESSRVPLDASGAAVLTVGLIALLLAIGQGTEWGWGSAAIVGLFASAAIVFFVWARGQLRRETPLVDLRQLRHRAVLTANAAAIVLGMAMYMYLTLVTEFVQAPPSAGFGFEASTLVAGLCIVPFSITSLLASRAIGALTRRFGERAVLLGGTLTISAAGVFFALEHTALWEAFVTLGVVGVGFGLTFAAIPGLIARSIPRQETGSALGLYVVIRSVGFSVGSALTASILASHTVAGASFPSETGFVTALWLGAGICLASALISAVLSAGRGLPPADAMSDRERETLAVEEGELASAGLPGFEPERPR